MRLIDADKLIEDLQYDVELDARALDSTDFFGNMETIQFDKDCKQNCIDLLRNAPTIDPVKHGRWVDDYNETEHPLFRKAWKCSACGFRTSYGKPKYCMNCGARMDGESDESA